MPQQPASRSTTVGRGNAGEQRHGGRQQAHRLLMAVAVEQNLRRPGARAAGPASAANSSNSTQASATRPRFLLLLAAQAATARLPSPRRDNSARRRGSSRRAWRWGTALRRAWRRWRCASPSRPCEISGRPQQPGRTTFTWQPPRLQNLQRGDADFGIVVVGEGVVEERDAACRALSSACGLPASHLLECLRASMPAGRGGGRCRQLFHHPARRRAASDPVGKGSEAAAPDAESRWMLPSARARSGVPWRCPVVGQEFALEARHVHADGTFGFAGAAFQAQVEHLVDAFVAQAGFAESSRHRQAQHVGAAARGVRLRRASPCTTGTWCRRVSCGRRRRRCTSRPRRPCRRIPSSRTTCAGRASGSPRRSADSR